MTKNLKKKKPKYKFNKIKHYHSLDDKPLFGVTTVLNVIAKPALIGWASNMAIKSVRSTCKLNRPDTKNEREEVLLDAKGAHHFIKVAGGNVGTNVHEAIEKWIKKGKMYSGKDEQVAGMFKLFVKWAKDNKVEFLIAEKNVWSEEHWYGGIVDFVCIINGKRFVGDIKTSNGIYPEHFLQMGAYDICLEEMGDPKADGYIIVNLTKDGKIRTKSFVHTKKFRDAFLHALELYKTLKTMKWNVYY